MEIPNFEKYEAIQLKPLHFMMFRKEIATNHIKRNILKFNGFQKGNENEDLEFISENLTANEVVDVCGILEIPARPNNLENIRKIIERLTPDNRRNSGETSSLKSVTNELQETREPNEKEEIRVLLRKQSKMIFELQQEIFDAEDELEKDSPSINEHQLNRLRSKLSMHESRRSELESEFQLLQIKDSSEYCFRSDRSISVQNWVNNQDAPPPDSSPNMTEMKALKDDIKIILSRNASNLKLSDFDGKSPIDWSYFKLRYEASTKDLKLSSEDNIIRLNTHLKGAAREKVDLLLKTCKNPDAIMRILNLEYGGKEKILNEVLVKIETTKEVKCVKSFRDFNCAVQNISSVMTHVDDSLFDVQKIIALLIGKIPDHLVGQWANFLLSKKLSQKDVTFELFQQWIEDFSTIVSDVSFYKTLHTTNYHKEKQSTIQTEKEKDPAEITNFDKKNRFPPMKSSTERKEPPIPKECRVCKLELHPLAKCEKFLAMKPQQRYATTKRLNFCTCCLNRHFGSCKKKQTCQLNNCSRFHHPLLHSEEIALCNSTNSSNVLLKVLSVKIRQGSKEKTVVAFLDEGATVSMIDSKLIDELKIQGVPEKLCFKGIGNTVHEDLTSKKVSFEIAGENSQFYEISDVHSVEDLELPKQNIDMDILLKNYPQLKSMNISTKFSSKPQLLLGQRHASLIISRNSFEIENGLVCSKTRLGWAIHGPISSAETIDEICCLVDTSSPEQRMDELIREQFILENFGVNGSAKDELKEEDQKCLNMIKESIKKYEGYYEVALPWKNSKAIFPNTLPMAIKRLQILERKFSRDVCLKESYEGQIQKLFDREYAEKISFDDIKDRKKVWVLPHFAVLNPKKPHKPPRVVFDAAAKIEGQSLNDFLHTGPDWLTSIVGVLIRFRQYTIAFAGDIGEMFNRVKIKEEDTYAQCFLWTDRKTKKVELYKMKAMLFGMKSSPFLAQFVKNYNASQYEEKFPEAHTAIIQNHYVDDYLDGRNNVQDSIRIIKEVIHVHSQAGFQIRSFASNNNDVLESIPEHLRAENFTVSVESRNNYQKVLGMNWNAKSDNLEINSFFKDLDESILNFTKIPTKRQVLKITMSIFDPLGLLSPVTIKARLLMQYICECSIGWDTKINPEMFEMWKKWLTEAKRLNQICIPRCYCATPSEVKKIELHTFSDASGKAYCSVAYYRFCLADGSYKLSIVYAKSRVNPKSVKQGKLSIPRMELMAAVLGTRIASLVISESSFKIDEVFYWTDSSTVMVWIQNKKKLPVFESNRVKIILENSTESNWRWLSTKTNIADMGTRDNSLCITSESEWFLGPKFLYEKEDKWELFTGKYDRSSNTAEFVMLIEKESKLDLSSSLPLIKRFSAYETLMKVTAWIGRFITNMKLKMNKEELKLVSCIDQEDLRWALTQWVQLLQNQSFPDDLLFVKQGINRPRRLIKHSIKLEGDIMVIDGRLTNCSYISERTKNPIILDGNHDFVKLLVMKMHEEIRHRSLQTLVNNFRLMFWMPKMKLKIKSIVKKCLYCRKRDSKPVQPQMGVLPECRFNVFSKPFRSCGIDYFGPINVKVGRRLEQRYGVLFTCMTSRAIHVEIACSLNADSCILAIRRMKSRRGNIDEILSDNATNFKASNMELLAAISELHPELMMKELQKIGIVWKNIPARSPHFGGAWERLIGAFKRSMESIFVCNRNPSDEVLYTVFCETEYLINSRPLYSVSDDPLDPCPITPNHLLIPGEKLEKVQGDFSKDELHKRTWRIQQYLTDCFWKRFLKEYIPTLLLRSKWEVPQNNLGIGDLVYLKNQEIKKGKWPLGRVIKVYPGIDSAVRVVDVKYGSKVLKRAANQLSLCKLED